MNVRFRSLGAWPAEFDNSRKSSPFRSGLSDSLELLRRELRMLGAERVEIEIGLAERDIRLDGWPRADARVPDHPGAIVNFDSRHGPLRYGTAAFSRWQDNVRAIALGLEALRKVDRYGIGKRGEQYVGWKALGSGIERQTMIELGERLIDDAGSVRAALMRHHPDHGGDSENFAAVQAARDAQ